MLFLDPWRRAPLLLSRRRSVAVVLAAAAAVLAAAAASGPLFVSSATDATLAQQLTQGCQQHGALVAGAVDLFGGSVYGRDPLAQQMFDLHSATLVNDVGALPHIGPPVRELWAMHMHLTRPGSLPNSLGAYVTVMSKTGALDNVQVVERSSSTTDGVWLADTTAAALHAKPGGEIRVDDGTGQSATTVTLPVAGIYRDLQKIVAPPFWCADKDIIYARGSSARFPLALLDAATADRLAATLHVYISDVTRWPILIPRLDSHEAAELDNQLRDLAVSLPTKMDAARSDMFAKYAADHPNAGHDEFSYQARLHAQTNFDLPVLRAKFVSEVLPSTVLPITFAAIAVALLLVGGSASFWFERRRREVDVLLAHGVPPWALGVKAVLEAWPPVVVGGVVGWCVGHAIVAVLGPSSVISAPALRLALIYAGAATGCGLVGIGAVAALRCRRHERRTARRATWWLRLPWDIAVPGAAAAVVALLGTGGAMATSTSGGAVARIDPVVLVAPLLAFVAGTALAGRIGVLLLRRLRNRGNRLPNAAWLAWRRVTGAPAAAAMLVGAVALPTAIGVYGAIVNASAHRTLADQDGMFVGTDLVVDLAKPQTVPAALRGRASLVLRRDHPSLGGTRVSVIGVDAAMFANVAFWDGAMPGPSVPPLIRMIHDDGPGKPLIGVVSGGTTGTTTLSFVAAGSDVNIPVHVVAARSHLPGERAGYPVLYVARSALERLNTNGNYQFWIRGDPASALDALDAAGIPYTNPVDASTVTNGSYLQPVSYTFSFLDALIALATTVGAGALLLYLDARGRTRRVAYVLTRRMGLSKRGHVASIVIELAAAMFAGVVVGIALAIIATGALHSRFNVNPGAPPSAILSWPLGSAVAVVVVVVSVLAVASFAAHYASDRARPAEVLREP